MARERHTPTPWYTGDERPMKNRYGARVLFGWDIVTDAGLVIASCDPNTGDPKANAAYIVAAVNGARGARADRSHVGARRDEAMTLTLEVSAPVLRNTLAQLGYWWAPPDGLNITSPSGFVAHLAPPALACERLALLTLGAMP